jgi:hypothetical protein
MRWVGAKRQTKRPLRPDNDIGERVFAELAKGLGAGKVSPLP